MSSFGQSRSGRSPRDGQRQVAQARLLLDNFITPHGLITQRGRWLALALTSVSCAAVLAHQGYRTEIVMAAIAAASLVASIAGFAFSAICGAVLFHLMNDPIQVVQLMIICSIANQLTMTWQIRRHIKWRELGVYLAGGVLGLTIGLWVLLHADRRLYSHAFGAFLLTYGAYMLVRRPVVVRRQHVVFDLFTGFLGGITGGAAGFPGAAVTIWCSMKGWDKARQRGVIQPFILIMQVAALLAIGLLRQPGAATSGFYLSDLLFIPASLLGTALGLALYKQLSDSQFARAVNVLLIISGLSYVL